MSIDAEFLHPDPLQAGPDKTRIVWSRPRARHIRVDGQKFLRVEPEAIHWLMQLGQDQTH